ncbi:MAG: hypothetical protein Q4B70_10305 [Lachnospiraceae bacterium]|nr:hypothetical protein [Lachnospiraceae bacterium]
MPLVLAGNLLEMLRPVMSGYFLESYPRQGDAAGVYRTDYDDKALHLLKENEKNLDEEMTELDEADEAALDFADGF